MQFGPQRALLNRPEIVRRPFGGLRRYGYTAAAEDTYPEIVRRPFGGLRLEIAKRRLKVSPLRKSCVAPSGIETGPRGW